MAQAKVKRECPDCGRTYSCPQSRKSPECPPCVGKLQDDGVKSVKQPPRADVYEPRYNGMKVFNV